MILGIGNDIVEIARIKATLARHPERFLSRVFTSYEQEYCFKHKEPVRRLAGRFAAKEAIVKAFGTGFSRGLSWLDIEIRNDSTGKPAPFFSSFARDVLGDLTLHLSISHCHGYATAFAIWVRIQEQELGIS